MPKPAWLLFTLINRASRSVSFALFTSAWLADSNFVRMQLTGKLEAVFAISEPAWGTVD